MSQTNQLQRSKKDTDMKFTFETHSQGFTAARCDTWANPTNLSGMIPITNKDGKWIARVGNTTADVTKVFHDHDKLNSRLVELVGDATQAAVKSLRSSHLEVVRLETALKEATIVRNDNLKLAAAFDGGKMTLRHIAAATRSTGVNSDNGLSFQRISQIVNA